MSGFLYLVSTPIGNLEDITLRALRILREEVSLIACEDTRQTLKLLQHFEIKKPLVSYHEHNENARTPEILRLLEQGDSVALVTDAGTPLVSDPGYRVVAEAVARGFRVVPIPGASAVLAAVAASGLAVNQFRFIGFLPAKAHARRRMFQDLVTEADVVVAYESPHRIAEALADIAEILGERPIVLARELTKLHEEFLRGSARSILDALATRAPLKGEITLLLGRAPETAADLQKEDPRAEVLRLEQEGMERMQAIKAVAKRFALPKRQVYQLLTGPDSSSKDKRRD